MKLYSVLCRNCYGLLQNRPFRDRLYDCGTNYDNTYPPAQVQTLNRSVTGCVSMPSFLRNVGANLLTNRMSKGRPRRRWVDNIRMDLQEVGCGYMDWIGLAQDRDGWRRLVSAVMNLRVP